MSWLLGAAIVGGALGASSTAKANAADKDAAQLEAYQREIEDAQNQQSAYTGIQNMITDLGTLESTQASVVAAQGKRTSGGSVSAIQEHQRGLLTRDIEDIERSIEIGSALSAINTSARFTEAANASKSRWLSWGASTLTSVAKVF